MRASGSDGASDTVKALPIPQRPPPCEYGFPAGGSPRGAGEKACAISPTHSSAAIIMPTRPAGRVAFVITSLDLVTVALRFVLTLRPVAETGAT